MRAKWPILATFLAVATGYAAYPYVTLYRLSVAVRSADAATLESLVDWPSVREGIKEDICDTVMDDGDVKPGDSLPPFGASFMRGIASATIDQRVTPQAIAAATIALPASTRADTQSAADVHVNWAFFDSPTEFGIALRTQGLAEPIRLEMELHSGAWQIRRVWLPAAMLTNAPART